MINRENIICISSIDWDFIWQGHQEIMSALAKNGNRILFIENTGARMPGIRDIGRIKKRIKDWLLGTKGIREEKDNLYIFSPIVLPFPYSRIALKINQFLLFSVLGKWFKIMDFNDPLVWVFLPTPLSLKIIDNLNAKLIIYYCIDNFRFSSVSAKKITKPEINLLKKADLVFVTSMELYNYCSDYNSNVHIFPFAVNFAEFEQARIKNESHPALRDIKRPIIGYVGGVHKWVDLNLIKKLAEQYRAYSFVFIGPIQTDISMLSQIKNIYFLGKMNHAEIPSAINNFDISLIPYLITDYTKNVYPTKLNEYLAMGKSVISTSLPEVINFNEENEGLIFTAKTTEEFINLVPKALEKNNEDLAKRIASSKKNSWAVRIEEMSNLVEDALDRKSKASFDWKGKLLKIYVTARKKILKLAIICICIYWLLFYTPLIWFVAEPLKIVQAPRKADSIVVFAGGVGESGKAGQGYEERVKYAVELFKNKYADNIIFSSGYRFIFQEAVVMKALAVSQGIPDKAIILEEKSENTYENVMHTREILEKKGWRNILLVSTPYHMRRVYLVAKKIAPEINITYTPIPRSEFYGISIYTKQNFWGRKKIKQFKGILHEYLGIIYYYLKRYI